MEKPFIDKGLGLWYFQIQFDRFLSGGVKVFVTYYLKKIREMLTSLRRVGAAHES
jgi:hypothetical protein